MSTTYLFLNSRDSLSPSTPHNSEFFMGLRYNEKSSVKLALEQCSFVSAVYPINRFYDTLVVEENGAASTTTFTLTHNQYNGTQLAAHLQTVLNAGTQESTVYTVTYDTQSKKLTFAGTNDFRILAAGSTCLHILGLDEYEGMTTAETTYVSPHVVRLDGTAYVDVISSLSTRNISSNSYTNIVARVYITASFGYVNSYDSSREALLDFYNTELSSLSLRLVDDRCNPYELPSSVDVAFTIKLIAM